VESFIDLSDRVTIGYKGFGKVGLLFFKEMGSKDSNGSSNQSFKNHRFLGWVVVEWA
jgi:hypothetical protein